MPAAEGIVKDIISPLVKRLDNVSRLPDNEAGSAAIDEKVGEIKKQLESLQREFERDKDKEKKVSKDFGVVLQRVDEMLEDAKTAASGNQSQTADQDGAASDSARSTQLQEHLEQIKKGVEVIIQGKSEPRPDVPKSRSAELEKQQQPPQPQRQPLEAERRIQESDAMSHLRLIIENLDTKLKRCLFCLTIFPEDAVIKKRLLIHWWMGESIVQSAADGKKCFDELSSRGLIIPIMEKPTKQCKTVHSCKVHPWIRKLLMSIATSNAFLEYDSDGTPSENYSRTHRAFLLKGRSTLAGRSNQNAQAKDVEEDEDEEEEEEDKVLTLYNIDAKYVEFESSWFAGKKELGALQLGRWKSSDDHHIEISGRYFLEDLGACKNLRYLSLRGMSRVESLPDSISNLGKLAVLDLRACHNLEKLTSKVSSLENLEYLDVSECYLLDQLPKGLKNLTKLEVLKGFVIAHAAGKDPCRIGELATLVKLRKLSISVGQESDDSELQSLTEGSIEFKAASLTSLTVTWGVVVGSKKTTPSDKTTRTRRFLGRTETSKMTPPPAANLEKLEKLDIRAFPEKHFPEWISPVKLPKLKKLYIRGGELESFGQHEGWKMEVLRIRFLHRLSCDVDVGTRKSLFPDLCFMEIHKCPGMSSWRSLEGVELVTDAAVAPALPSEIDPQADDADADAAGAPLPLSTIAPQSAPPPPLLSPETGPQAAAALVAPDEISELGEEEG